MSELEIVKRLREITERAKQLNNISLNVGIPSDKNEREKSVEVTNAELGIIHEFGAPERGIPERSFMRSTAKEESKNVAKLAEIQIKESLNGEISAYDAFSVIGNYLQVKIVDKITDGNFEENTKETIKRKKSSKPLIDTGQLRASITYEIKEK